MQNREPAKLANVRMLEFVATKLGELRNKALNILKHIN